MFSYKLTPTAIGVSMSVPWLLLCCTATNHVGFFLYFVLGGAIGKHFVSHFVFVCY
ncbi:hypothetical protein Hanom_Chr10g00903071 [Helianthus anomalus]